MFASQADIRLPVLTGVQAYAFLFSSRRRHTRSLCDWSSDVCSFLFQAEDGIRDHCVTRVQTCALPISKYSESSLPGIWLIGKKACGNVASRSDSYFESLTKPTTWKVRPGSLFPLPTRKVFPTGFVSGKNFRATTSFTTATPGAVWESLACKSRPASRGVC